jgi:hypothetical protein
MPGWCGHSPVNQHCFAGGTIACVAGLRWALRDVDSVPPSITAWPWEPEAWGFPPREASGDAAATGAKEGETSDSQHPPLPPDAEATPALDAAPDAAAAPPTPSPDVAQKEE